jgi:hypothetical protein
MFVSEKRRFVKDRARAMDAPLAAVSAVLLDRKPTGER